MNKQWESEGYMKKLGIIALLLCAGLVALGAQERGRVKAGQIYLGANTMSGAMLGDIAFGFQPTGFEYISADSYSGSEGDVLALNLNLEGGYFLTDNLAVGLDALTMYYKSIDTNGSWSASAMFAPGLEVSYLIPIGSIVVPYVKATANYLYGYSVSSSNTSPHNKDSGFMLMPMAGVKLFVADHASLDITAFYHYMREASVDDSSSWYSMSSFGFSFGVTAYL